MPPRYVYWTILIDNKPTAFRARDKEDLLPTVAQLRRTNADVVLKWFARGRVWDSPEEERAAQERPRPPAEKRGRDWRPGGQHKDPRDRFRKPKGGERDRSWAGKPERPQSDRPQGDRPWRPKKPFGAPGGDRSRWQKPGAPGKPSYGAPRGDRPDWRKSNRPPSGPPRGDRPQGKPFSRPSGGEDSPRRSPQGGGGPQWQKSNRPPSGPPGNDRRDRRDRPQWGKSDKTGKPPYGAPRGERPWSGKARGPKPWQNKPRGGGRPLPRKDQPPPKKRDDEE